jgi:hypothetical protein
MIQPAPDALLVSTVGFPTEEGSDVVDWLLTAGVGVVFGDANWHPARRLSMIRRNKPAWRPFLFIFALTMVYFSLISILPYLIFYFGSATHDRSVDFGKFDQITSNLSHKLHTSCKAELIHFLSTTRKY